MPNKIAALSPIARTMPSKKTSTGSPADYFRIGDKYYRSLSVVNHLGHARKSVIALAKSAVIDDLGKDFLASVPQLEGFCNVPAHENYARVVNECLNLYHALPIKPAPRAGKWPVTQSFLKRVFGEHVDTGLDYLQLLYTKPTQKLPILILNSEGRAAGKTTFLNWLGLVFGGNAVLLDYRDLASDFNAPYLAKCLALVDEGLLAPGSLEQIKSLNTCVAGVMQQKGESNVLIDVHLHFVLASNDPNFQRTDKDSTVFWVRNLMPVELVAPDLLQVMRDEIPAFLHMLGKRTMKTTAQSRNWFTAEQLG